MRQETITLDVYSFNELSDKAKEKARDDYRMHSDYPWHDENRNSIETFCKYFGVKLTDWSVGADIYNFRTDAENNNFRGHKLREFTRDHMPTGYCLDYPLWSTFYDSFKRTGDAKEAFDDALRAAFMDWCSDIEYYYSDEAIDEAIDANGYEFLKNGKQHF